MTLSERNKRKEELTKAHYEVSMSIALYAIRINEMDKNLKKQADQILMIESELEQIRIEENGKGFN